jgi:hypothetical protein
MVISFFLIGRRRMWIKGGGLPCGEDYFNGNKNGCNVIVGRGIGYFDIEWCTLKIISWNDNQSTRDLLWLIRHMDCYLKSLFLNMSSGHCKVGFGKLFITVFQRVASNLAHQGIIGTEESTYCVLCAANMETSNHVFLH